MKIQLGYQRKHGLPNYGSIGASCHMELEASGDWLTSDAQRLRRLVRRAYRACRRSVSEELARQVTRNSRGALGTAPTSMATAGPSPLHASGRWSNGSAGYGGRPIERAVRMATERQLEFARKLANGIPLLGADQLNEVARELYERDLENLTSQQASKLIDHLQDWKASAAESAADEPEPVDD